MRESRTTTEIDQAAMSTQDDYFDSILNSDRICANYDEAIEMCRAPVYSETETFDLIPALGYHFSERIKTPQHYARAKMFMRELASACLDFNISEAGSEAANAAMTECENAEPELTAKEIQISIGGV